MSKRKEFTFLEAMDLINAGETMESCEGYKYRSYKGKFIYNEPEVEADHLNEMEFQGPWLKVEKEEIKDIKVYIHVYKDADNQQTSLTELTLLEWDEYIKINKMYEDDTLVKTIILKNIEDQGGEGCQ